MPRDLAALIDREQLTQWFSVPSVLSYMANFDAVPDGGFASLRRVIWCGDVLPTPVLKPLDGPNCARAVHEPLRPH